MVNSFQIKYLSIAQKDLTEIIEYIMDDNPSAALEILDKMDTSISKLENFPYMGCVPKDTRLKHTGYRILIVDNYLVFYVVFAELKIVEIRRILHGRRHYNFLLET